MFLVDPNAEHGPIGYPWDGRKLLPVFAKPEVVMADVARSSTGDHRTLQLQKWLKTVTGGHFRPNRKQKYGGNRTNEIAATDFLFDFLYIIASISTLSATLLVKAYHCAHVNRRWTWKFWGIRSEKSLSGRGCQNALFLM